MKSIALKAIVLKGRAEQRIQQVLKKKHDGVDGVVVALILVVVAVAAAILFRSTILTIIKDTLDTAKTQINALFSGTIAS